MPYLSQVPPSNKKRPHNHLFLLSSTSGLPINLTIIKKIKPRLNLSSTYRLTHLPGNLKSISQNQIVLTHCVSHFSPNFWNPKFYFTRSILFPLPSCIIGRAFQTILCWAFFLLHWMNSEYDWLWVMAEAVPGIHTPPLQLTNIDQGMYVIKTHFTLQYIILLALFCFYVVYKYGISYMFDKSPK